LVLVIAAAFIAWFLLSRGRRRAIPAPSAGPRRGTTLTEREA